jgi:predicted nucleotidyltransferase
MIVNIYPYGSRVYGTADEKSDTDLILVSDSASEPEVQRKWPGIDVTIWTVEEFQRLLDEHDPSALECWFLPDDMAIRSRGYEFKFKLDRGKLRRSFSAKASNSWVKAKKKMEIHGELRLGMKSLFHSLRLLGFGIQIAGFGELLHYNEENSVWRTIVEQGFTSWQPYKDYWQKYYNNLHSEFKLVAPLPKGENK